MDRFEFNDAINYVWNKIQEVNKHIEELEDREEDYDITGYVSKPSLSRSTRRDQKRPSSPRGERPFARMLTESHRRTPRCLPPEDGE